jgi:threonine dehydrogenase-like Zn-dependent dehydrogenase
VSERSDEAIERVRELTGGLGAHSVLECVGYEEATLTALSIARPGGAVGRVGVPQSLTIPVAQETFYSNVTSAELPEGKSSSVMDCYAIVFSCMSDWTRDRR